MPKVILLVGAQLEEKRNPDFKSTIATAPSRVPSLYYPYPGQADQHLESMSTPEWGSHSTAHCPLCRLCLLPHLDRAREARRSPRVAVTLGVPLFPVLQLLPENGANGDEKTA